MKFSWTTRKVAEILGLPAPLDLPLSGITTDSRAVVPGSLFIAIRGDQHDGHDFIASAVASGASAIVSEKPVNVGVPVFEVPSTLEAIRKLAHAWRQGFSIPFIAVVGAVGKTTTKELIASILSGRFRRISKTEGSQNGFLGIPLTLLAIPPDAEIAVIEIGIDEIGAMARHLEIVEPTHLILTRTGPEHLHQLKTVEIAAAEELLAFDYAVRNRRPLAINLSDEFVKEWFRKNKPLLTSILHTTYSLHPGDGAEITGRHDPLLRVLSLPSGTGTDTFPCPLPGEHHSHNLLAAIVVSRFFGLNETEIQNGLSTFKTAYGRTEIYSLPGDSELIGDYYNSNPTSALAALKLLTSGEPAETHAVLGDMLELGEEEERFHRELAGPLIALGVTRVWLYGPRMRWLQDELDRHGYAAVRHFEDLALLSQAVSQAISPRSKVLVKGSRGMRMEKVVKALIETGPLA
jgi:UDP-N-acetylmuramoyl-tripeptide--D-alanyl-D-alanine ligase